MPRWVLSDVSEAGIADVSVDAYCEVVNIMDSYYVLTTGSVQAKVETFLSSSVDRIVEGFISPLMYFGDPSRRLYWLFLASSLVLAALAYALSYRQHYSLPQAIRALCSRRYWFNRSTATDVFYLFTNSILKIAILVPLFGSHLWATIIVARFFQGNFGNAPELDIPVWLIMVCFTVVFFLLEDVTRFLVHFSFHKIPFLWRFHKVHHSANVLTPITVHRVHPIEMLVYFTRGLVVFGLVSGVFVYMFGSRLSGLQILGVDAFGFMFNVLGANLRHSHVWLSFGRFERWFISPAQHQIHHSVDSEHHDKNMGTCLAIWDRLAGSLVRSSLKVKKLEFGLYQH